MVFVIVSMTPRSAASVSFLDSLFILGCSWLSGKACACCLEEVSVSGLWATSFGSSNVSTCCLDEDPGAGLLGTVLLVAFLWLCQNSSIDPASGLSLRCSSSDPLVLLQFPRFSINVSTCCLEDVPGVGLLGTLSLFGFLCLGHASSVGAVWVWRMCVSSSVAVSEAVSLIPASRLSPWGCRLGRTAFLHVYGQNKNRKRAETQCVRVWFLFFLSSLVNLNRKIHLYFNKIQ